MTKSIAIICLLLTSYIVFSATRNLYLGLQSVRWPQTRASQVRFATSVRNPILVDPGEGSAPAREFSAYGTAARYEYTVGNETYTGNRATYSSFMSGIPDEKSMIVSYDPATPSRSVVYPGICWTTFAWDAFVRLLICFYLVRLAHFLWRLRGNGSRRNPPPGSWRWWRQAMGCGLP